MQRLPNLITSLHKQGIIRSSWQQFAQDASDLFEADGCSFYFRAINSPESPILFGTAQLNVQKTEALIGYDSDNPVCKLLRDTPVGQVIYHGDIALDENSKEYVQHLSQIVAVTFYRDDKYEAVLSFGRHRGKTNFGDTEIELLNEFLPYLQMAIDSHVRQNSPQQTITIDQYIEQFTDNLVVVDEEGVVLACNRAFEVLKSNKSLLYIYGSKVNFYDKALQQWMSDAIACRCTERQRSFTRVLVQEQEVVLKINAFNDKEKLLKLNEKSCYLLTIENFDANTRFEQYKQLFKLTKAEAELAAYLSMGKTINQLASQKLLSKHTLRTQLKSVFMKTRTHSQNELIVLLKNVG
jgi:DNA-binding CsgD family transcriptional regulator